MVSAWQEPPDAMSAEKPAGTDGISAEKPAGVRDGLEVLAFSTTRRHPGIICRKNVTTRDNRTIKWGDPPGRPSRSTRDRLSFHLQSHCRTHSQSPVMLTFLQQVGQFCDVGCHAPASSLAPAVGLLSPGRRRWN